MAGRRHRPPTPAAEPSPTFVCCQHLAESGFDPAQAPKLTPQSGNTIAFDSGGQLDSALQLLRRAHLHSTQDAQAHRQMAEAGGLLSQTLSGFEAPFGQAESDWLLRLKGIACDLTQTHRQTPAQLGMTLGRAHGLVLFAKAMLSAGDSAHAAGRAIEEAVGFCRQGVGTHLEPIAQAAFGTAAELLRSTLELLRQQSPDASTELELLTQAHCWATGAGASAEEHTEELADQASSLTGELLGLASRLSQTRFASGPALVAPASPGAAILPATKAAAAVERAVANTQERLNSDATLVSLARERQQWRAQEPQRAVTLFNALADFPESTPAARAMFDLLRMHSTDSAEPPTIELIPLRRERRCLVARADGFYVCHRPRWGKPKYAPVKNAQELIGLQLEQLQALTEQIVTLSGNGKKYAFRWERPAPTMSLELAGATNGMVAAFTKDFKLSYEDAGMLAVAALAGLKLEAPERFDPFIRAMLKQFSPASLYDGFGGQISQAWIKGEREPLVPRILENVIHSTELVFEPGAREILEDALRIVAQPLLGERPPGAGRADLRDVRGIARRDL